VPGCSCVSAVAALVIRCQPGSPESYATFKSLAATLPAKVIFAGLIWAFVHHFCAGIRFLLLDLHIGIEKEAQHANRLAVVLAVSIPLTVVLWGVLL
jgi:succinate dehydrogenase / fumarate reductase, cytochrome b subunit